ncbi:ATP-binding response regulator [Hydrogenophaga sp.]|uniref:ATP-binding response regulator n=1 Tax=Hydrogenophaga sp. TaxID=1904254 RepID=UPI003F6FA5E6
MTPTLAVSDSDGPEARASTQFGLSAAALEAELEYMEVDQSMNGARGVVVPYCIILLVLLGFMLPYADPQVCALWAGGFASYILARSRMNRLYAQWTVEQRKARLRKWHRLMIVTAFLFGAAWGLAALIPFEDAPLEMRFLWTLALTMVVAGAPRLLTMAQFISLVVAILVLAILPWLQWGGEMGVPATVALVSLAGLYVGMARQFHRGLREKFELQLRNAHLARVLGQKNDTLEQTARANTLLLAAASHDLRQPVHALGLLMEIIQRTLDPQALRRRLVMATDCVESLSEMLSNLLDFTRMDSGNFPVDKQPAPLQPTLDEALRIFGPIARRKGLALHVQLTTLAVQTDPQLLRRMLFNLVSNAVKYTDQGHVRISVVDGAEGVTLQVEDTGAGIEPSRLEDIFRDYVTSSAHSPHFDTGIGLGLGIVSRCSDLLGHRVSVESEPARGSRFSIHLGPAVLVRDRGVAGADLEPALAGVVAVVENDPVILEGLTAMLREWGCHPVAASTSAELQALLSDQQMKPALILSDLHLGEDDDGFRAIEALRQFAGETRMPAVVLTGDLGLHHQARAAAQQIRLEHKPLRPARLRQMLGEMLAAN